MSHEPAPFFVLRTPLLPFDGPRDLRELVRRPEVREALFLASPSLEESLAAWEADPQSERGRKVELTLVKYAARLAGRATPFGLFAGCSVGTLGDVTDLELTGALTRRTRLDGAYLEDLARTLAAHEGVRLRPSSGLYRTPTRIRVAGSRASGRERSHFLASVEATPHLEAALERARGGATAAEIAAAVSPVAEATPEEALAFVAELRAAQLLVPDLEPPVTGPEPLAALIEQARAANLDVAPLEGVRRSLADLDARPPGSSPATYRAIAESLEPLGAPVELPRLFQVDLGKPSNLRLDRKIADEVLAATDVLRRLFGDQGETELDRFRHAFLERWEGREVPFLVALDEETGIGFGKSTDPAAEAAPLLKGVRFPSPDTTPTVPWGPRADLLLRKLETRSGAREVAITDADVDAAASPRALPLPDAFAALISLSSKNEIHIEGVSGPSGARLLGRFCHLDSELQRRVEEHLRAEEALRPEAIFAEVVHLPEGHLGNVIVRPVLREYEIPFLGRSGAKNQIPLEDLLVSAVEGRIVLRSRRLGREVLPRLTSAINPWHHSSMGWHRFLAAVQEQGVAGVLAWSWGPLEGASFLPRVVRGKVVLSLARWNVRGDRLARLKTDADVASLRRELDLPRWIALREGDNVLPVDLENPESVRAFRHLVKDRPLAVLAEPFPGPEDHVVRGPGGRYVNEIVLPFVRTGAPAKPQAANWEPRAPRVARSYPPGSEWLYAKIYTGTATADAVLLEVVRPLIRGRWFFIRYADPHWHLRVRFTGERLWSELLPTLHAALAPWLEDGRVSRFELATYERERDRYGGWEAIEHAERLFQVDSEAVLALLDLLPGDAGAEARWRLALRGCDALLDDFGFDLAAKRRIVGALKEGYGRDQNADDALWRQLGQKLRPLRPELEALLAAGEDHPLGPGIAVLAERSRNLRDVVRAYRELPLVTPLETIVGSFLHMHVNRLLRSSQNAQEVVLYYFLERIYEGLAARRRQV